MTERIKERPCLPMRRNDRCCYDCAWARRPVVSIMSWTHIGEGRGGEDPSFSGATLLQVLSVAYSILARVRGPGE
jgi:hypothetical protein